MDFKYKIADVAKEFGVPAKKVIETVSSVTGEAYKTGGTFGEKELDFLLESLTRENAEPSLDAYLASGVKEEPSPPPRRRRSPTPRSRRAKNPSPSGTTASPKSRRRSAMKSASPCRSWRPIPASRSRWRLPSRCRSTAPRCRWIPARWT